MSLRVVFLGEIVGKTGVFVLKSLLKEIKDRYRPDFVVAGADSATGGAGLGVQHAVYLRKLGVDCLTLGECAYYKLDMTEFFPKAPWVLRPANLPYEDPGRGWRVFQAGKAKLAVVSLLGQASFPRVHAENPLRTLDYLVERVHKETANILVDFHASATAEKLTLTAYADGKVSAVVGTHGKALTADARVSAKGTAAITDAGRTGSLISVGGLDPDSRVKEYLTAVRVWEGDGTLGLEAQGVVLDIDDEGKALGIESFRIPCEEKMDERAGNGQGS